jgi:large conductance mechanosensitive channel
MLKEFKEFALRGNVVDMAVGIIIGGAFGTIARSLVDDVLMPPIGLLVGGMDFGDFFTVLKTGVPAGPYATLADARTAGAVTLNYGVFGQTVISFLVVAAAVFVLVRSLNRMRREGAEPPPPPTVKECPFCATQIPIKAVRCPQCTSQLK